MSGFDKKKKNWNIQDDEDSGSESEEEEQQQQQQEEQAAAEAGNDEDSDSESEDDTEKLNITVDTTIKKTVEKQVDVSKLSKAERKALKQKELDDLDALLGEFGVKTEVSEPAAGTAAVTGDGESKSKKKKQKKKKAAPVDAPSAAAAEEVDLSAPTVDVAALKKKLAAKNAPAVKKPIANDPQAIALALTAKGKKDKKKKDTSTFSEYSY